MSDSIRRLAIVMALLSWTGGVTLAQEIAIDTSGAAHGIVAVPDGLPSGLSQVFVRYTKVMAPNGKPIHLFAQDGWSEARILKARNVLEHILRDVPGTRFGADKRLVANTMAHQGAAMGLFNDEPAMRAAFRGPLRDLDLAMQDLRANEAPIEGHDDYMAHRTRDASFEEILHLVHDTGIKPALPEMQDELRRITEAAIDGGLWEVNQDDRDNEPNEYFAAIYDNYLDLWTVPPTVYEGRPIAEDDVPEGTSHFGIYRARGREGLRARDPEGLAILQEFFPPYLTYTPRLPEDFSGFFSLAHDPDLRYTVKSQHLRNVTLAGEADAALVGNGWDNRLTGNAGDNRLRGGGGDDLLDGGPGNDTAVYEGAESDYRIVRGEGWVRVSDRRIARDGSDLLLGIERLEFAATTVAVGERGERHRAPADDPAPVRVLIVDGVNNHDWQSTTAALRGTLETTGRFRVEVATSPSRDASPAAWEGWRPRFADHDVVVGNFNDDCELDDPAECDPYWSEQLRADLERYVREGGGYVPVHAADNAWAAWPEYNRMIGLGGWGGRRAGESGYLLRRFDGEWRPTSPDRGLSGEHGEMREFLVIHERPEHPILAGLPTRWMHARDELYSALRGPAEGVEVLAYAESRLTDLEEPVLMLVRYASGTVVHLPLGHYDDEFEPAGAALGCVGFQTLFARGVEYAATGAVTIAVPARFPDATGAVIAPPSAVVW